MEAVQQVAKEQKKTLNPKDLTKDELTKVLKLFVWSIRRVRLCGTREIADKFVYYEKNLRNSGLWLSATSMQSNRLKGGIYYYISCSSDKDEDLRQWINFDCNDSLALVTSSSDDISTLIGACEFLREDIGRIVWQIEHYKD